MERKFLLYIIQVMVNHIKYYNMLIEIRKKKMNTKLEKLLLGFASGVMIAASFWSLLAPAISLCIQLGTNAWLTAAAGFLSGGVFIMVSDALMSRAPYLAARGSTFRRNVLLCGAVALHNIPEGLAVGVSFGCAALGVGGSNLSDACMLALGIGLQNFPEGTCVSLPLHQDGMKKGAAFFWGQLSAVVEPMAGLLGVLFALKVQQILPLALTFSAGAMISVVCSELIPESFTQSKRIASVGVMLGFTVMMILDVALG